MYECVCIYIYISSHMYTRQRVCGRAATKLKVLHLSSIGCTGLSGID